jgi:hypothetical protein
MEPTEICVYLQRCENSHNHSRLQDNRLYHTPIDLTFISVPEGRLVRGSSRDKYFALSYVWGGRSIFQTTTSNRSILRGAREPHKHYEEDSSYYSRLNRTYAIDG